MAHRALLSSSLLVLFVVPLVVATVQAAPPIAMAPTLEDELSQVPRDWNVTKTIPPYTMDVLGMPRASDADSGNVEVAYRFHNDIGALEGSLTRPRPGTGQPNVVYNTGMRLHAITFDPPLDDGAGHALGRLFPGPLAWSALQTEHLDDPAETTRFTAWAAVPRPDNDTVSPPEGEPAAWETDGGAPRAWLLWTLMLHNTTQDDPFTGAKSPANVRFSYLLVVDQDLVFDPEAQRATTTLHFDFGGEADGRPVAGPDPLQTTGVYLNRSHSYATLRLVDRVHSPSGAGPMPGGATEPIDLVVHSEPTYPEPSPDQVRRLFSPLTLNASFGFVPSETEATWSLAGSPTAGSFPYTGFRLDGEFGYLRHAAGPASTHHTDPGPSPGDDQDSPAPGLVPVVVATVLAAALRHRTREV